MSLPKKHRIFQAEVSKAFPERSLSVSGNMRFASAIAEALRREFFGRRGAVKIVARLTGANERAVKNWFDGKNGPSGEHLVVLAQHCSQVLESFLLMAARGELVTAKKIVDVRSKLKEISIMIDEL
jgi:hypothetical protein